MSASRLNWIAQPFAIMGLAFGKISVAFLLLRLIGPKSFWRRNFLYFTMIGSFLFCALATIFTFVQCNPVQALWNPTLVPAGQAKCWEPHTQSDFSLFVGSESSPPSRGKTLRSTLCDLQNANVYCVLQAGSP